MFALGANLGAPLEALTRAGKALAGTLEDAMASAVYRTPPEEEADQPDYLNAVIRGKAALTPHDALVLAARIESEAGRVRTLRRGPRVLDVDVLFVGGEVVDENGLHVPHERWATRDFVVVPLLDVAPEWRDPRTGRTVEDVARAAGWTDVRFPTVLERGALLAREVG